ncbi:MAG: hypothetical protein JW808_07265 [Victivallales bacterium]|nr:hypothetical protein [Victivallales bacterium]
MAIKRYDREGRKSSYGVMWRVDGKRKFRFFQNRSLREDFFRELQRQERKVGRSILEISSEEAVIMKRCLELMGTPEKVLLACQEISEKSSVKLCPASKAVSEHLAEKRELGRDSNYERAVRKMLERALDKFGESLSEWSDAAAREWRLELSGEFKPVTVRNHLKKTAAFVRWCMSRKYMAANPFANLEIPGVVMPEPQFLSVADTKKLFLAAQESYPQTVAYLALGAFAGIRSSSTAQLGMEGINFEQRGILIMASQAKNKRRVYLDGHEPNLWAWLEWARDHAPEGFSLTKRQWDRIRRELASEAKVKMPHNALRHSFCTYHTALYGDAGRTATLLTHKGNVSILYEHYRGNASKPQAQEYFSVFPGTRQG